MSTGAHAYACGQTPPSDRHPVRFLSRFDKSATNIKESELFITIGQVIGLPRSISIIAELLLSGPVGACVLQMVPSISAIPSASPGGLVAPPRIYHHRQRDVALLPIFGHLRSVHLQSRIRQRHGSPFEPGARPPRSKCEPKKVGSLQAFHGMGRERDWGAESYCRIQEEWRGLVYTGARLSHLLHSKRRRYRFHVVLMVWSVPV